MVHCCSTEILHSWWSPLEMFCRLKLVQVCAAIGEKKLICTGLLCSQIRSLNSGLWGCANPHGMKGGGNVPEGRKRAQNPPAWWQRGFRQVGANWQNALLCVRLGFSQIRSHTHLVHMDCVAITRLWIILMFFCSRTSTGGTGFHPPLFTQAVRKEKWTLLVQHLLIGVVFLKSCVAVHMA